MSKIAVDKEEYIAIVNGANKLMDAIEMLKSELMDKNLELNSLQFLKAQSGIDVTDTLTRMKKFTNES